MYRKEAIMMGFNFTVMADTGHGDSSRPLYPFLCPAKSEVPALIDLTPTFIRYGKRVSAMEICASAGGRIARSSASDVCRATVRSGLGSSEQRKVEYV